MWEFWLIFFLILGIFITVLYCTLVRASDVDEKLEQYYKVQFEKKYKEGDGKKCQKEDQE